MANRPTVIDLFGGAGGLSLGFEMAGFDIIASVDLDPIHCAIHSFNFPMCLSICADVSQLTGAQLHELIPRLKLSELDAIIGGAPCQGFSLIGKRNSNDPRNELIKHFIRLVVELKPKYFVLENVPGITCGSAKLILDQAIAEVKHHGYRLEQNYQVLNAADFGVPQDRRRLFLIGSRSDQVLPSYPEPKCVPRDGRARSGCYNNLPLGPSVWQAIQDLPDPELYPELQNQDWTLHAKFGTQSNYVKRLNSGSSDYAHQRVFNPKVLTCSLSTNHSAESRARFAATSPGSVEPVSRFLRLDPNGMCNTLRAGTGPDKGSFSSPRPIHCFSPRCITVREAARLHSYPDWFRFHSTKWHGMRQIGNSVPPLLAKAVAEEIVKAMHLRPTRPKSPLLLGPERLLSMTRVDAFGHFGLVQPSSSIRQHIDFKVPVS